VGGRVVRASAGAGLGGKGVAAGPPGLREGRGRRRRPPLPQRAAIPRPPR
jgi:hypothetical protein